MRSRVIAGLAAALCLTTSASADPAPKASKAPFHISFDRPASIGDRNEFTGTCSIIDSVRGAQTGLNLGDNDEYLQAKYDVIEKVVQVEPNGEPQEMRVYFRTFKMRTDSTSSYDDASCIGVPIDVVVWPDVSIAREDGQDILPDEMTLLRIIYPKQDPSSPSDDDTFAPPTEVSVGQVWHPSGSAFAQHLQSEGLVIPDNAVDIGLKVTDRRKVNGVDCAIVTVSMSCRDVDGITTLPDDYKSVHANVDWTNEFAIPVDSTAPIMVGNMTRTTKFTAVVDKDDTVIEIKGQHAIAVSESFVKSL